LREFMTVVKALGDENRVRALLALRGTELCLCQLVLLLGLAPSTVSKHMSILKHARLVDSHKSGRWVYYHLAGNEDLSSPEARGAVHWLCQCLSNDSTTMIDEEKLRSVLELHPRDVCKIVHQETGKLVCGSAAQNILPR
jgi:ArsR family transcriptional regulator, arsenate/arsenite/antimonite-responsive transcriptional repressor